MRILVFYPYFCTPKGAWGTRWYELGRRFVEAGHRVTIVTSHFDKSDIRATGIVARLQISGIDVRLINLGFSNRHGKVRRIAAFAGFSLLAMAFSLFHRTDLVIASSGPITVGIPALVARFFRWKPMIFEVRDLWPEGAIQLGLLKNPLFIAISRWFERLCYRSAHSIVALSPGMQEGIRRLERKTPIEVITNGSDLDLADGADSLELPVWAEGRHLLVYCGSLGRMNNPRQLVDWAKWLQEGAASPYTIVVIGDGSELPALKMEQARNPSLKVMGPLPKQQVFAWLQHAFAAILIVAEAPLMATNSPNKLFDAFAAGVPVLQTTHGWIEELLRTSQAGVTLSDHSPNALLAALAELESKQKDFAMGSRNLGRCRFNRDHLAQQYLSLITELVKK